MSLSNDLLRFIRNPMPPVYHGLSARLFHWITALAVVGVFFTAFFNRIFEESEFLAVGLHRQIGVFILAMTAIRFLWRVQYHMPVPSRPASRLMHAVSNAVQSLLYGCLIAQPLIGWLYTNAKGPAVVLAPGIELPRLVPRDPVLAQAALEWHAVIGWTFACLIGLHLGGALFHHFVRRDGLLLAMLPARRLPRFIFQGRCEITLAEGAASASCDLLDISAGGARLDGLAGCVTGQAGTLRVDGLAVQPPFVIVAAEGRQVRLGFTLERVAQAAFEQALVDFVAIDPRIGRMVMPEAIRKRHRRSRKPASATTE